MNDDMYKDVPSSNIISPKHEVKKITLEEFHSFNEKFWKEQSVELHKCYKQGHSYANNTNKKDSIDLLKDMNYLLQQQFKDCSESPENVTICFEIIKNTLLLVQKSKLNVDKNCILSILQGFTIGCLKFYDQQTTN